MQGVQEQKKKHTVAHPNDLASSIRPSDRKEVVKTQFTNTQRYSYIDEDYSYTDPEKEAIAEHREQYINYIRHQRNTRNTKQENELQKQLNNDINLGMKFASGLNPPKLKLSHVPAPNINSSKSEKKKKSSSLLSSKEIDQNKRKAAKKKVLEGLKAVPLTEAEKDECSQVLTPQELFQVAVGRYLN
jgi:hypothetical protein